MREVTKDQTGKKQIGVKLALWLVCLIVVITASIVFIGCNKPNAEEGEGNEIEITIIQSEYEYDGEKHWIEVSGVKEGDEVRYSTDGEKWESARPEYSEPGRVQNIYQDRPPEQCGIYKTSNARYQQKKHNGRFYTGYNNNSRKRNKTE